VIEMDVGQIGFLAFLLFTQKPAREHGNAAIQVFGEAARLSFLGIMAIESFRHLTGGD
tara:strand:+ start:1151 stop:1324 length:174 start_codon:yes stop_codon:yes gene_type:complete